MKTRIAYLDNLRTFAIFLVVVVHSGLVYEQVLQNTWIVVDPDKADWIGLIRMYLDLFIMFTIFFISGYLVPVSAGKKTTRQFIVSKVKRILVPWLIAVLTLIPLYKMIFLYSRGLPQEPWYTYFHLFHRTGADPYVFSDNPTQNWLWFLPVLFVFQLLYLAIYKWKLLPGKFSLSAGVLITFLIGVVSSMLLSHAGLTGWQHSAFLDFQRERLIPYFMVFLLGTLCYRNKVLEAPKNVKAYIIANVVLTLSLGIFTAVALNLFFNLLDPEREYYFISGFADSAVYYVTALGSMFSFLYILIYAFRFTFNKTSQIMKLLNRNSYAVYIIHMIVVGLFAFVMVSIPIPAWSKFVVLTVLAFIASNVLVSGYRRFVQKHTYLKLAGAAAFVLLFLAFTENHRDIDAGRDTVQRALPSDTIPDMSLHEAVIRGDMDVIGNLISRGADPDEKEPTGGSSPLITAALFGKTEAAEALIEAGADLDFVNFEGSTALITAAFFGRTDFVRLLLENGADTSIRNNSGSTAYEAANAPFESVKGIYDYFRQTFGPMGLRLDDDELKAERQVVAGLLK